MKQRNVSLPAAMVKKSAVARSLLILVNAMALNQTFIPLGTALSQASDFWSLNDARSATTSRQYDEDLLSRTLGQTK